MITHFAAHRYYCSLPFLNLYHVTITYITSCEVKLAIIKSYISVMRTIRKWKCNFYSSQRKGLLTLQGTFFFLYLLLNKSRHVIPKSLYVLVV